MVLLGQTLQSHFLISFRVVVEFFLCDIFGTDLDRKGDLSECNFIFTVKKYVSVFHH